MKSGVIWYWLKSQKLTIRISASGTTKNSANTAVRGTACHQADKLPAGGGGLAGLTLLAEAVAVTAMGIPWLRGI